MNKIVSSIFVLSVALPWLNPFTPGPSALVATWLISLAATGAALLCCSYSSPVNKHIHALNPKVTSFFFFSAFLFALLSLKRGFNVEAFSTLLAWLAVLVMAIVGAALGSEHGNVLVEASTYEKKQPAFVRCLAKTWLAVALISCAIAIVQFLQLESWFTPWISKVGEGGIAISNLRQRNLFSTLCGIGFLSFIYILRTSTVEPEQTKAGLPARVLRLWLVPFMLATGNALSGSRTGVLEWLCIALLLLLWRKSLSYQIKKVVVVSFLIFMVMTFYMPFVASYIGNTVSAGLIERLNSSAGHETRLTIYSRVVDLISAKPWLGWGWRELAYAQYSSGFENRFGEIFDNAHNLPLHLAVELGLPFAVAFFIVISVWVYRCAPWHEQQPTRQLAWGILMLIGVHSMLELPLWSGPFLMTLGVCIGLLSWTARSDHSFYQKLTVSANTAKLGAGVLLMVSLLFAVDYTRVSQMYLHPDNRYVKTQNEAFSETQKSVLFKHQVEFAELSLIEKTPENALYIFKLSSSLIHHSPEPRVIEPLIESAKDLNLNKVVDFHTLRYSQAFPKEFSLWKNKTTLRIEK
jgi:Virulence factor membrane-bound polymerase, C-terminal/O-Antigen ligase